MKRRQFALVLAGLASLSVLPVRRLAAQDVGGLPKVAILAIDTPDYADRPGNLSQMLASLAELGYVDGQNVSFAFRFAHNAYERLPGLAAELVAWQPDVLWTWTSGGARAAAAATSTIPIVIAPVNEATLATLVPDFARPPGNITGMTLTSRQQHEKCLQLLKEAVPSVTRVGVLVNPLNPAWDNYPQVLSEAARALGIKLIRVEARGGAEIDQAFEAMAAQGADGLFGPSDSTLIGADPTPERILELLASLQLPSASDERHFVQEGGLLSLGPALPAIFQGAATYIDRILKGTKVAELPVEHPSKFVLGVNLKTAQALGITVPTSLLLRADEVIE
jgi:putative ABC transport system substrate-binding protein